MIGMLDFLAMEILVAQLSPTMQITLELRLFPNPFNTASIVSM